MFERMLLTLLFSLLYCMHPDNILKLCFQSNMYRFALIENTHASLPKAVETSGECLITNDTKTNPSA